ncbi:MAG: RnfABCDGE type electron transport complex subunit D [Oscillospiraceae bacterium]|nr:RnfABCDGE type electron transport complex subunit D [Oscillospiraceae bacterium]
MDNLIVSVSPHIRAKDTTASLMRDVLIALLPAVAASVLFFGTRALLVEVFCVAACVGLEWLFQWGMKRPVTIADCSAAVTGLILALNLPVGIPLWMALVGCAVAILVVKQLFGGIGHNFANPAITARIVMFLAFSSAMAAWVSPNLVDAVSSATPLAGLKNGELVGYTPLQLFLGAVPGCLGETSALALLLGGVYLLARRVITWHTPLSFICTVFVLALLLRGPAFALAEILAGGLFLGAIFMATDYATTPSTAWGRVVFGVGCGLITCLIRFFGNYPEGVSFSILLMNILTPYISKWTRSKPLGGETK